MTAAHAEHVAIKQAAKVARILARKCWWAEEDDLRQAGAHAAIKAIRAGTFDPGEGVELDGYLYRAALYGALRTLRKASAPVNGTATELRGLYRASLYTEEGVEREELQERQQTPEREVLREDFRARVRTRLAAVLGEECAQFGLGLIGGVYDPADVAEDHGCTVTSIYRLRDKIARRLDADTELHQLWQEMTP